LIDDLQLTIETTWLEQSDSKYNRVVVLNYTSSAHDPQRLNLAGLVREKLEYDIGIKHQIDYVFSHMARGHTRYILGMAIAEDQRVVIRLKDEEHFVILKLHYAT